MLLTHMAAYINESAGVIPRDRVLLSFVGCFVHDGIAFAELSILSHSKKAAFWRELVESFPGLIDYLCNSNTNFSQNLLTGLDE